MGGGTKKLWEKFDYISRKLDVDCVYIEQTECDDDTDDNSIFSTFSPRQKKSTS